VKMDKNDILRVAELARLELTDEEKAEFSRQLSDIISYVEKINELNTENVDPTDHIVDLKNVLRDDAVTESIEKKKLEKIAPRFEEEHFVVPRIIED
jgi:aspartyl-tRNA(Asn)/glutamyl-tRNA(Gln) amidotransferase subunit C